MINLNLLTSPCQVSKNKKSQNSLYLWENNKLLITLRLRIHSAHKCISTFTRFNKFSKSCESVEYRIDEKNSAPGLAGNTKIFYSINMRNKHIKTITNLNPLIGSCQQSKNKKSQNSLYLKYKHQISSYVVAS